MYPFNHATIQCPYCWSVLKISIEPSDEQQTYIEDCQVCCQPMVIEVRVDELSELHLTVRRGND